MKKEATCFDCGKKYDRKALDRCPRCGDERVFIAAIHSDKYDIAKDPDALFKLRIYGVVGFLVLLISIMNLTH